MYRPHKCCELEILGSEIIHQTRPSPGLKCKQEYDPGNGSMIFWFYFTSCQQSTRKEGIECFENVDIHFTNKYLRSIKKGLIQMVVCIVCNICNSSNYQSTYKILDILLLQISMLHCEYSSAQVAYRCQSRPSVQQIHLEMLRNCVLTLYTK